MMQNLIYLFNKVSKHTNHCRVETNKFLGCEIQFKALLSDFPFNFSVGVVYRKLIYLSLILAHADYSMYLSSTEVLFPIYIYDVILNCGIYITKFITLIL